MRGNGLVRSAWLGTLGVLAAAHFAPAFAIDQCAPPLPGMSITPNVGQIKLDKKSGVSSSQLNSAIGAWNGCAGSGYSMPSLSRSSGDISVDVRYNSGKCSGETNCCGTFLPSWQQQGSTRFLNGGTVTIYQKRPDGSSCVGDYTGTLTHELGHVMGLGNSDCGNRVMGNSSKPVTSADCAAAGGQWFTPEEQNDVDAGEGHMCRGVPR